MYNCYTITNMATTRRSTNRRNLNLPGIVAFLISVFLLVVIARMVLLIHERSNLATERRDAAQQELLEVEALATKFEQEAYRLESTEGKKQALRNRYGIVSENEGYLILLHHHQETSDDNNNSFDWRPW